MSYDLSKLKLNNSPVGTVAGIKLNGTDLTGLKGIMLNGDIVIEFGGGGGGNRYADCGPGVVTGDNYNFALVSDTSTRLDTDIVDEEANPYIPYRGIAGLMRAAAYANSHEIGEDVDYADPFVLNTFNLSDTGHFGYPFNVSSKLPGSDAQQHLKEQFEAVSALSQNRAFISNFEPIMEWFNIDNDPEYQDTMASGVDENILYDTTGQAGGIYMMSDGKYLNMFTYNHAALWYQAGVETATRNWYDSSKGILFVDVEDIYISMFLEGLSQSGTVNSGMLHKTSISTDSQSALRSLLADGYDESDPTSWYFKSDVDFGLVVTSMGIGTVLKEEPDPMFVSGSYGAQLWTIITNTVGMYGLLVDEFPCLQQYSYAKFNTTDSSVSYQFLGPIGVNLDPLESSSLADYASTYLHEIFPDFSSIGEILSNTSALFNNGGFSDFLLSTNTPSETTQTATFESVDQDAWYNHFNVTFNEGECNIISSETIATAESSCTYKGADVPTISV